MARDVEFNVTASDRTGSALAAAERNFERTKKKIDDQSKKTGEGFGKGLGDGIDKAAPKMVGKLTSIFGDAGLKGGPAIAAGLAAAAPFIGAVISGAIIGGAGIGGVIGGVALAARDQRVKDAGKRLSFNLMSGLEQDASVFVEPTLRAVDKIERRFESMRPRLKSIFEDSADFLDPLLDGALDAVDGILRGVQSLIAKGGPVIDSLGRGFSRLGDSMGNALTIISGGSEDAATALDDLFRGMAAGVEATAWVIRGLTELYGVISYIPGKLLEFRKSLGPVWGEAERVGGSGTFAAEGIKKATAAMSAGIAVQDQYGNAVATTGSALLTLTERINQVNNATRSIFDTQTGAAAAFDNLTKSIKENGRTLDVNSEKGRANRQALSNLASALNASYQAYAEVNGEGVKANGIARSNYNSFIKAAQGLGISKAAAQEYARKLGLIPPKKNTSFTANTHDAEARVQALNEKIARVQGKTVYVNVITRERKGAAMDRQDDARGFSAGDYWSATAQRGATSRTGGPEPVNVSSDVMVNLDGQPFYAMTARAVQASADRQAWRTKVGRR